MDELLKTLLEQQKRHLLKLGRQLIPTLTPDDILQPNDYPELENNPVFRYEEGILAGIQSVQAALLAMNAEKESNSPQKS